MEIEKFEKNLANLYDNEKILINKTGLFGYINIRNK